MSPISSRKSVPPSLVAILPGLSRTPPVKAPLIWPNSSLSSSSADSAGQGTVEKGLSARGLQE